MSEVTEVMKPKFDPNTNYKWNPEDKFELTGQEFAFIYNSLNAKRVEALQTLEMFKVMEQKLIKAVEDGIAVESIPMQNEVTSEA